MWEAITFREIVKDREASVRLYTDDDLLLMDLLVVVTGMDRDTAKKQMISERIVSDFDIETVDW